MIEHGCISGPREEHGAHGHAVHGSTNNLAQISILKYQPIASTARASWGSRPDTKSSSEIATTISGTTPVPSISLSCQVRNIRTGRAIRYPAPTLNDFAPLSRPAVLTPTTVARLFSRVNAATISAALAVCSFTSIATRP